MIFGKKQCNKVKLIINSIAINENNAVELLGITIDNTLTFNEHINNLCRNASYALYGLRRIRKYLTQDHDNYDNNKFTVLLWKGVYPYEFMDDWEKFN